MNRGNGKTTDQMKLAPRGAVYRPERFTMHGVSLRAYVLERMAPDEAKRLLVQVALEGLKK